jgi:iron complex outermembrane recepter protein
MFDTVQPGVGIFLDGIYQPDTSYLNSPIVDVQRIEVLRGPQGTLFGNNTLGGAINVLTRQPSDDFVGKASAAYAGPDNFYSAALSASGPIIPGVLQARVALADHSQDGFERNTLAGDRSPGSPSVD